MFWSLTFVTTQKLVSEHCCINLSKHAVVMTTKSIQHLKLGTGLEHVKAIQYCCTMKQPNSRNVNCWSCPKWVNTEILSFHLNCPFNFLINDILILLKTPKKQLYISPTLYNTQLKSLLHFQKKIWKELLLKYIILLYQYDCWSISLLYRHWNFEQEEDNSNVYDKCFLKKSIKE